MAALTVRTVKVAVLSGAAVPVIGFFNQLSAKSPDGDVASKPIRACDIPMYSMTNNTTDLANQPKPEPNVVQQQITSIRIFGTGVYNDIMSGYETVKEKAEIGVAHSKSSLDFVQNNPGELPRVGFITLAVAGGVILGYRRSVFRKLVYATIGGLSAAALCYPNTTVDLTNAVTEDAKRLWEENVYGPLSGADKSKKTTKVNEMSKVKQVVQQVKEDHGQSKAEDKDLYSTRSSS